MAHTRYAFVAGCGIVLAAVMLARGSDTPQTKFNKAWTMADLLPAVADLGTDRDWAKGETAEFWEPKSRSLSLWARLEASLPRRMPSVS